MSMTDDDKQALTATLNFLDQQDEALETHTPESLILELKLTENFDQIVFGSVMVASALLKFMAAAFNVPPGNIFQQMIAVNEEDKEED